MSTQSLLDHPEKLLELINDCLIKYNGSKLQLNKYDYIKELRCI